MLSCVSLVACVCVLLLREQAGDDATAGLPPQLRPARCLPFDIAVDVLAYDRSSAHLCLIQVKDLLEHRH